MNDSETEDWSSCSTDQLATALERIADELAPIAFFTPRILRVAAERLRLLELERRHFLSSPDHAAE